MTRQFERDCTKDQENIGKHGISFAEAVEFFDGPMLTAVDDRFEYDEMREISMGFLGDVCRAECRTHGSRRRHTDHLGPTGDQDGKDAVSCLSPKNAWLRSARCPMIKSTPAAFLNWMTLFLRRPGWFGLTGQLRKLWP